MRGGAIVSLNVASQPSGIHQIYLGLFDCKVSYCAALYVCCVCFREGIGEERETERERMRERERGTYQLLLLHTLHEDDEEVLCLRPAVGEGFLDGHQQLVSQRLIN